MLPPICLRFPSVLLIRSRYSMLATFIRRELSVLPSDLLCTCDPAFGARHAVQPCLCKQLIRGTRPRRLCPAFSVGKSRKEDLGAHLLRGLASRRRIVPVADARRLDVDRRRAELCISAKVSRRCTHRNTVSSTKIKRGHRSLLYNASVACSQVTIAEI